MESILGDLTVGVNSNHHSLLGDLNRFDPQPARFVSEAIGHLIDVPRLTQPRILARRVDGVSGEDPFAIGQLDLGNHRVARLEQRVNHGAGQHDLAALLGARLAGKESIRLGGGMSALDPLAHRELGDITIDVLEIEDSIKEGR